MYVEAIRSVLLPDQNAPILPDESMIQEKTPFIRIIIIFCVFSISLESRSTQRLKRATKIHSKQLELPFQVSDLIACPFILKL